MMVLALYSYGAQGISANCMSTPLEMDPAITTLHQVAKMLGNPLQIGGHNVPGTIVDSIELGHTPGPPPMVIWEHRHLKSAPPMTEHHREPT